MRSLTIVGLAWLQLSVQPGQHDVRARAGSVEFAWKGLATGIEYAAGRLPESPEIGDGLLHVVRIDPMVVTFELGLRSLEGSSRTAGSWADSKGFVAVINAGMYQADGVSNVGFLRYGAHANNPRWNAYQSVLALESPEAIVETRMPRAVILDRDAADFAA